MPQLTDRCCKAVTYFHQTIVEKMLIPLNKYITSFNAKKAKTFHKNLCGLELDLKLFIENMKKVRYNDIPLVKGMVLPVPERDGLYRQQVREKESSPKKTPEPKMPVNKTETEQHLEQPRIPSPKQSFFYFREGLSIQEIAKARNIAETTVASHLAEFVLSGELPVTDFISQEKLIELTPFVQAAIAEDNLRLAPIKELVGEQFSYNDIRFVLNHHLCEKNRKK